MKAAVVRQFNTPVVLEDRPIPEPGPGQVLVKIEASGLCHTDIHAAHGDWPVKPAPSPPPAANKSSVTSGASDTTRLAGCCNTTVLPASSMPMSATT